MIALDLFRSQINEIMRRKATLYAGPDRVRRAYWLKRLRAEHRASGEYQISLTRIN